MTESWDSTDEGKRHMMILLIKVADLGHAGRPFEIANKTVAYMCDEFFQQGDLSKASGMVYTSETEHNKETLDQIRSQVGFYESVCLPLFEYISTIVPKFQPIVERIQDNIVKWKETALLRETESDPNHLEEEENNNIEAALSKINAITTDDNSSFITQQKVNN